VIRAPGNYVEAVLNATTTGGAWLGILALTADWRNLPNPTYAILVSAQAGHVNVIAPEITLTTVANYTPGEDLRVRVEVAGNEVKFYAGDVGPGAAPVYVSPTLPDYPLRAAALAHTAPGGGSAAVKEMMLTIDPFPATVITADQQQQLYGSLKEPLRVRIRQHSGIRQVGYGIPWEEDI
jgi:hypothetical protein